jgi:hypothetical protein
VGEGLAVTVGVAAAGSVAVATALVTSATPGREQAAIPRPKIIISQQKAILLNKIKHSS